MYFESWIFGVRNQTNDESSARLDGGVFDLKIAKIKIVVEEAVEQNSSFLKIPWELWVSRGFVDVLLAVAIWWSKMGFLFK